VHWGLFDGNFCVYALSASLFSKFLSVLLIMGRKGYIIIHSDSQ